MTGFTVENSLFFEAREGIRRQYIGPQVAVVARRVTTRKDVAERMREAAPGWARHHGDLLFNLGQGLEDFRPLLRRVFRV